MSKQMLLDIANRPSYYKARAEAMGFKFADLTIEPWASPFSMDKFWKMRVKFQCVCGRLEMFEQMIENYLPPKYLESRLDYAYQLTKIGSFSREHLLADGFSKEQCDEFEARALAFDNSCRKFLPYGTTP